MKNMSKRFCLLVLALTLLMTAIPASALAAGYLEATGGSVNVRSGPGTEYSDLYTLVRGEKVDYTGDYAYDANGTKWYKVQYYSYGTGWVCSKFAKVDGSDSGSTTTGSYVKATADVNIRKNPSLNGKDLGTMKKGQTGAYLGQSSTDDRGVKWYNVNFNGTVGWVSSRYSKLTDSSSGSSGGSGTAITRYVTATASVNIRKNPNLDGKDLGTMKKGQSATYLGQSSTDDRGVKWYKVNFGGTTGWVSSRHSKLG